MKLKTTKDKILYIIKKDNEVSMKDLMDYFSISEVAVRKQLNELIRLGFITDRTEKKEIGRPIHIYSLTKKGHQTFPNQYEDLPSELLQDLEALQGTEAVHNLLRVRKKRQEKELKAHIESNDFSKKIKEMVEYQEENGYMLDVKETEEGDYEIKNFNCPVYNLASNYNIVCTNERICTEIYFPTAGLFRMRV